MTGSRVEHTSGASTVIGTDDRWTRLLVPVLTALMVLALGMILVGLTSRGAAQNDRSTTQPVSAPSKSASW